MGVTLLHREHVTCVDGSSTEFTDHNTRELVVMPASHAATYEAKVGKHAFTSTRTVWTFGSRTGEDICHHCVHCSHTKR